QTMEELLAILDSPKSTWTFSHKKNGILVHSRAVDFSPALQGEVDAPAEKVFSSSPTLNQDWDPVMAAYRSIQKVDENSDMTFTLTHPMWMIAARDYFDLRVIRHTGDAHMVAWRTPLDGTYNATIPSDVDVTTNKPVRGFNHVGGIRVSPSKSDAGKSVVEYMVHSEIKMPVWIVNKGTGGAIDGIFTNLRKAVQA
ncbi:hypothetical protein BC829DRAFT_403020, partial [Chytridium lagenaria]